jgi:hypothetical protein
LELLPAVQTYQRGHQSAYVLHGMLKILTSIDVVLRLFRGTHIKSTLYATLAVSYNLRVEGQ